VPKKGGAEGGVQSYDVSVWDRVLLSLWASSDEVLWALDYWEVPEMGRDWEGCF
jgi:hypothetical protein